MDAIVENNVALAVAFWKDRNVVTCPRGISTWVRHDLPPTLRGQAEVGSCTIQLNGAIIGRGRYFARRFPGAAPTIYAEECRDVVHEVGHALGLWHSQAGVMSGNYQTWTTPWECVRSGRVLTRVN